MNVKGANGEIINCRMINGPGYVFIEAIEVLKIPIQSSFPFEFSTNRSSDDTHTHQRPAEFL